MFSTVTMMMSASGGITIKENPTGKDDAETEKVKLSSISLYPPPEEYDYYVDPPSRTENVIKDTRIKLETLKNSYQPIFDKVSYIYNTGVAHTSESLIRLRDDDNYLAKIGVFTVGGMSGLLAARKGKFIRRLTYTSVGFGVAAALCYPERTRNIGDMGLQYAQKNAKIAYYFIVGSRPEVQNKDGKAFKSMTTMASDLGKWSVSLFQFSKPAPSSDDAAEKSSEKEELVKTSALTSEQVATEESSKLKTIAPEEPAKPEADQLEETQNPETQPVNEVIIEPSVSDNETEKVDVAVVDIAEDTSAIVETGITIEETESKVEDTLTAVEAGSIDEVSSIIEVSKFETEIISEEEKPVEVVVLAVEGAHHDIETKVATIETGTVPEEEQAVEVIVEDTPVIVGTSTINEVAAIETGAIPEEEKAVEVIVEDTLVIVETSTINEVATIEAETVSEEEKAAEAIAEDTPVIIETSTINEIATIEAETVSEEEKAAEVIAEDKPVIVETSAVNEVATIEKETVSEQGEDDRKVEVLVLEGDFGQGYPEDKSMYTTRE